MFGIRGKQAVIAHQMGARARDQGGKAGDDVHGARSFEQDRAQEESPVLHGRRNPPVERPPSSLIASAGWALANRNAGAVPNTKPVNTDSPSAKARIEPSMPI